MGKGMRAGKKPSKPAGMGGGSMQKQLQQMQAMQRQMEALQAEIEEKEVQTTAGGGAVSVTISGKKEISLRDLVCNVNILAIAIGLFLFAFQIRLPAVIRSAFAMAGNTMGPVAMLIIGMLMADMDMQHLRSYRQLWKPVLLRLIVLPVILVCVAKYSGLAALAPHGETLIIISLLSVIAPSANIVTQFSQMFGRDALYASLINTVTMLLCIITMPLMITLFQM